MVRCALAEVLGICQAKVACQSSNENIRTIMTKTVITQTSPTLLQNGLFWEIFSMKPLPQSVLHIRKERPHTRSISYFCKYPSFSAHLTPVTQAISNKAKVYQPKYKQNSMKNMKRICLRKWTSIGIPVNSGNISFSSSTVSVSVFFSFVPMCS